MGNVSWVMANNWLTQEAPGLDSDLFSDMRLFYVKYGNIVLKIIHSKPLLGIRRRATGL